MEGTNVESAGMVRTGRPFAWERSYPPGMDWDAPVELTTLPAMLDEIAAAYADRPALEYRGQRISFAGLRQRADRFAAGLLREGLQPGDRVALLLPNTPWHPIAFFAVLRLGGVVVHLSPLDPPRAHAQKLADRGARRRGPARCPFCRGFNPRPRVRSDDPQRPAFRLIAVSIRAPA